MLNKISGENAVVGTRRLQKAIENDQVSVVYVASDADLFIKNKLTALCQAHRVRMIEAESMAALGRACGIDVPAASAGLLRD